MEELKTNAIHCGLSEEQAELATGGFLSVLKKSKKLEDDDTKKIMESVNAEQALKDYDSMAFKASLPKPSPMMLLPRPAFAPPGPPPPVIINILAKSIKKATRKDKDAGNTEDTVKLLKKKGLEEEGILKFMQVFIGVVEEKASIDISEILVLPEDK